MSEAFDVAIVGYGPVGETLALSLGRMGLRVCVFERESSVYHQPRAGHLDGEVMRVFQSIGVADAVVRDTVVNPGMQFVNSAGELLLDWPRPQVIGPDGWHPSYRFHQPSLERVLRQAAGEMDNIVVWLSCEVERLEQRQRHVEIEARHVDTGETRTVNARYVVGCDGARSTVRRHMQSRLEDLESHERWLIIDVLLHAPRPDLPAVTVQLCDPARPMTMAKGVGNRRRWEIMLMPGDDPATIAEPGSFWPLLDRWVKPDECLIERAVVYTFHSMIASRWREGRLLLAGDACHQTPPFMGQGMCAGIRDVANLSWKLAAVLRGDADDDILDTYAAERIPHVRHYIETAIRLGRYVHVTDPVAAAERDSQLRSNPIVLQSPRPPLGAGLHGAAAAPAGHLSTQPFLTDGSRADDRIGSRFAVLCTSAFRNAVAAELSHAAATAGVVVIDDIEAGLDEYLREMDAPAVVVRPDRYVLGTARNAGEMRDVLGRIPIRLRQDA